MENKNIITYYEVVTDDHYGSDVIECNTLEKAKEEAKQWAKELAGDKHCSNVYIIKKTEEICEKVEIPSRLKYQVCTYTSHSVPSRELPREEKEIVAFLKKRYCFDDLEPDTKKWFDTKEEAEKYFDGIVLSKPYYDSYHRLYQFKSAEINEYPDDDTSYAIKEKYNTKID